MRAVPSTGERGVSRGWLDSLFWHYRTAFRSHDIESMAGEKRAKCDYGDAKYVWWA